MVDPSHHRLTVGVRTGASSAPERDDVLAEVDGVDLRMPRQSAPTTRAEINAARRRTRPSGG